MINIYPKGIEKILSYTSYIPRLVRPKEQLRLHHRYHLSEYKSYAEVINIITIGKDKYYTLRFKNSIQACISLPIFDQCWELIADSNNIKKLNNIINNKRSYSGAEIKFWFYINRDKVNNQNYKDFFSYLNRSSLSVISDDKWYYVVAEKAKSGKYTNCKLQIDRRKDK